MDIQIDKLKGPLMHEHKRYIKGPIYQTEYGALYNWYVANDIRGIISNGWRVPSLTDFTSLQTYLGGESDAGGKMKETGILYWGNPNIGASNSSKFNGRAGGLRDNSGLFSELKSNGIWMTSTDYDVSGAWVFLIYTGDSGLFRSGSNKKAGSSIRPMRDTNSPDGTVGTYTGNDGKVYPTICIGGQEWTSQNILETKYLNGDLIPNITDNTAWSLLSTGAMCFYNNDQANGYKSGTSTDNAVVRWDGTDGRTVQDSSVNISDAGEISVSVGGNKTGVTAKSEYIGLFGEGVGDNSYGVLGHSNHVPAQFCNTSKEVTGVKRVMVYRGDSFQLNGRVETGYALRHEYRLPVNDFTNKLNSDIDAGTIDCVWADVTTTLEACDFIFSLQHNGVLKPSMKLSGHGELFLRDANNTKWNQVPPPDEIKIDIDFLDLTPFVYNVPENMKLFQHQYEISAAILSEPLNTNMNKYTRLTITPTAIGLVSLKGILL